MLIQMRWEFVLLFAILLVIRRARIVLPIIRKNPRVPRKLCLIQPISIPGSSLPYSRWNLGLKWIWSERDTIYKNAGAEVVLVIPIVWGKPSVYVSSPEMFNEISGFNAPFKKSITATLGINRFGPNVIASWGSQWRRHRKIAAPAFDTNINEHVWEETVRLYGMAMAKDGWLEKDVMDIMSFNEYTTMLALGVISAVGFGAPLKEWRLRRAVHFGQEVTLQDTMADASKFLVPWAVLPPWIFRIPLKEIQRIGYVFSKFESIVNDKITSRKISSDELDVQDSSQDLFDRLLHASTQGSKEDDSSLSSQEVLGSIFAFLFAGHETTASGMTSTLALLALHPHEQKRAYEAVRRAIDDQGELRFADLNLLLPIQHCFFEAIRLFPPGYMSLRDSSKDEVVNIPWKDEGSLPITIPANTNVVLDMIGVARNPRQFTSPTDFNPTRWEKISADNLLSFYLGPRACLGRKFATVEAHQEFPNLSGGHLSYWTSALKFKSDCLVKTVSTWGKCSQVDLFIQVLPSTSTAQVDQC